MQQGWLIGNHIHIYIRGLSSRVLWHSRVTVFNNILKYIIMSSSEDLEYSYYKVTIDV